MTSARSVVLLRGVNVGGRPLAMAALRDALTEAGCTDVVTYIQSGNVVLTTPRRPPKGGVEAWLEGIVRDVAGFDVPVVLRTRSDLEATARANPYPDAAGKQLHVVFYAGPPPPDLVGSVDLDRFAPEHATLVGRDLYLYLPNGMGRAKLPVTLERAGRSLEPPTIGTARNWNTVLKLVSLAGGRA
jgi:uncharacterized protein (DUF1697 family)